MKSKSLLILALLAVFILSCGSNPLPGFIGGLPKLASDGPVKLTGEFVYTNEFVLETYFVEHAVALVDMHGFVTRDKEWVIPVNGQTLGFMSLDKPNKKGTYQIELPAQPEATYNDLSRSLIKEKGVQIFSVAYWGNLWGGPYAEADDKSKGWPDYLASTVNDPENKSEVTGGKLVVWAPDDQQKFPTDFGPDGLLFTADDPLGSLPAGYSVVDLDSKPFKILRSAEESLKLYEPQDIALKDFSKLSYTASFDKMFEIVRKEYAFNGVTGKQPDWDKLYAQISLKVKVAEQASDKMAFYKALREFTMAFKDGHVGLDGGDMASQDMQQLTGGGYGLAVSQLDDGKVLVTYVLDQGPASQAGIQVGAEVAKVNGVAVGQAISQVIPFSGPFSTDFSLHYQQARYLLRQPVGTKTEITYTNPGGTEKTISLTAVKETRSLSATSVFAGFDQNALPVEFSILDSGVGYIKINSNYDDLNLIIRLFQRALKTFKNNELPAIIIDMRQNTGGSPLGLAGSLYNKDIPLGQLEYYSDKTGKFEPEGPREKVEPNEEQFSFSKMALLVSQACYSACEIEAYGFSQVPGMIVVGKTPSSGTEAETARGDFRLPEGMSLTVPTGRFTLPDGSIFLEGKGVQTTIRVPNTRDTVLSKGDPVLEAAIKAVTQ